MILVLLQMSVAGSLQLPVLASRVAGAQGLSRLGREGHWHISTCEKYCFVLLSNRLIQKRLFCHHYCQLFMGQAVSKIFVIFSPGHMAHLL